MIEVPGRGDVEAAAAALSHHVLRTPVLHSDDLDDWVGRPVRVKAEGLQITGSFKVRGALNRIRTFSPVK